MGRAGEVALRTLRTLRADLWTFAPDPMPRMGGPRVLARLPHLLVVLVAVITLNIASNYNLSHPFLYLVVVQAAALVAALFRPLAAWWISVLVTVAAVLTARPAPSMDPGGHDAVVLSWTGPGMTMQAGVVFLLALRVRPRITAEVVVVSFLVGAVCHVRDYDGRYGVAETALLALLAAAVAGAMLRSRRVARTQLKQQTELTAEERARRTLLEERSRIARELHDVVAHHMSVISIQAQVAPHMAENPSAELRENLAGIHSNAVEALTELRRILGVLRAERAGPESGGVGSTADTTARYAPQPSLDRLDELVGNVRGAGLAVEVRIEGEQVPLAPGVELSAFRIVQEALSNTMRHAPGAEVRVDVGYRPDGLALRIANSPGDRAARAAGTAPGSGHGLLGMRERAAMLGGELAVGPTPEGGYEVAAVLPAASPRGRPDADEPAGAAPRAPGWADGPRPGPAAAEGPLPSRSPSPGSTATGAADPAVSPGGGSVGGASPGGACLDGASRAVSAPRPVPPGRPDAEDDR